MFMRMIAALAAAFAALPALAQPFPSKPVHLIVAYAPGGTGDVVARVIAEKLSGALGQSVVVENRAGASGAGAQRPLLTIKATSEPPRAGVTIR